MKSRFFVIVSLLVDAVIAISKFVAAYFTGSASMASEGVHSVIDSITQLLLIWGIKKSKRRADEVRPFGYGRELYFWSFIVSLAMFLLGGCISIYEGILEFKRPGTENDIRWTIGILLIAFVLTCVSIVSALRVFNKQRGQTPFWRAIRNSKDPTIFIVLLGDMGDLAGLTIAFAGVFIAHQLKNMFYDALASTLIGCIMLVISAILVRESKSLLMGETIGTQTLKRIIALAESDKAIIKIKKHFSTYMGPDEVILQLNAVFKQDLTTTEITAAISRIIKSIQQIFIEPVQM